MDAEARDDLVVAAGIAADAVARLARLMAELLPLGAVAVGPGGTRYAVAAHNAETGTVILRCLDGPPPPAAQRYVLRTVREVCGWAAAEHPA